MLGGVAIPVDAGDFRLMSRPVVLTLRALREQHRFVRGLVAWVGFRQTAVTYERPARFAGETKYPLRKMLRFAIDGITSFSTVPLRLATWLGVLAGAGRARRRRRGRSTRSSSAGVVAGWTTIMILVGLGSSAQLLMTGHPRRVRRPHLRRGEAPAALRRRRARSTCPELRRRAMGVRH